MEQLHLKVDMKSQYISESKLAKLSQRLSEFAALLKNKPFENFYGLRGLSAFTLYNYLKDIQPDFVVEVGVWKGFSTWIIENACPGAKILCLDPITNFQDPRALNFDFIGEVYKSRSAVYTAEDFSCIDFSSLPVSKEKSVVFFDDHNNKLARLRQAHAAGFRHIIYDDNWPFYMTHQSFENNQDMKKRAFAEEIIDIYEIIPPLWDVVLKKVNGVIEIGGMGFPVQDSWKEIYDNRDDYSFVTYMHLRD